MIITNQIALSLRVAARRGLAVRTVVASLALAAATIPVIAGDSSTTGTREDRTAIRPFHIKSPELELTELRKRINATKWPERETVADASQGVQLSSGKEHVTELSGALATFGATIRAAIDTATKAGDADTADLLTEVSRGVDKLLWFVEVHLQAKE